MTQAEQNQDQTSALRSLSIATAGHVDHGKTSLVAWLTGTDTDTLTEEKARGLTINLGFAYAHYPDKACVLGFVDVPGHRDFIHNMLAGVSAIDAALLVIAADDGIMPQTREHLAILDLLEVRHGVIAISKSDKCETGQLANLRREIGALISGTSLAEAEIVSTSCSNGEGLEQLQQSLLSLSRQIESGCGVSSSQGFRFQIDRSFSLKGIGTVVTGSAVSGYCAVGDNVLHSASGKDLRIRGLRFDQAEIPGVAAGQRAAINIATISAQSIRRGDWLMDPILYHPVHRIDVRLRWLHPVKPNPGAQFHLHLGAAHHLVAIRPLDEEDLFQIRSHEPMYCHFNDRFIVRDPTGRQTLGGGRVLDSFVPRRNRSTTQRLQELRAMDNEHQTALQELASIRPQGVNLGQFGLNRNLTNSALEPILEACRKDREQLLRVETGSKSSHIFARVHFEELSRQILQGLSDFHRRHPSESGLTESALSRICKFAGPFTVFKAVLEKLTDLKLLGRNESTYHLPGHQVAVSAEENLFATQIRPHLLKAGKIPPRTRELVELTGIELARLEKVLKHCVRRGQLIRVADNRHYLPETIQKLAEFTESMAARNNGEFSVIDFRDASGIGRNLSIEILEYFDHVGFTRRQANTRVLRTSKDNIFS